MSRKFIRDFLRYGTFAVFKQHFGIGVSEPNSLSINPGAALHTCIPQEGKSYIAKRLSLRVQVMTTDTRQAFW
jgi:hypothetical protein